MVQIRRYSMCCISAVVLKNSVFHENLKFIYLITKIYLSNNWVLSKYLLWLDEWDVK